MMEEPHYEDTAQSPKRWSKTWEWVKAIIVAVVIAAGIHQFLFAQFVVAGHSMDPTLADGERLIIDKVPYYFSIPKRGDVIVFHAPDGDDWVKRVIGLPGDTVAVHAGQLLLDGKIIRESFLDGPMDPSRNYGPTKVPPGDLFVMGDNRNISEDSRVIGPIPINTVVGRVDLVFWPLAAFHVLATSQERDLPQTIAVTKR